MSDSNYDREEVFSKRVRAGKRTYFFDVKKSNTSRGDDFYITITESKKKFEGYVKHKIFLYKEDFNKFSEAFTQTVNHVKSDLMPEYDFDEYTNREENNDSNI